MVNDGFSPVVGISLGSAYSRVAVWRRGEAVIVANADGERETPSSVAYAAGEVVVGLAAKNQLPLHADHTIADVPALLGRTPDDPLVHEIVQHTNHELQMGENGIETMVDDRHVPIYEALAEIIKDLALTAESFLGEFPHGAVYCLDDATPARAAALEKAADLAGCPCIRIVDPLTAAAIASGVSGSLSPEASLIVDAGATTTRVAIVNNRSGVLYTSAVAEDKAISGMHLDDAIAEIARSEFSSLSKSEPSKKNAMKLDLAAEECRRVLTTRASQSIEVDAFADGHDLSFNLSKARYDTVAERKFRTMGKTIMELLTSAKYEMVDIGRVVLVGGVARTPKFQNVIQAFLEESEEPPMFEPAEAPEELSAQGAAVLAGDLHYGTDCGVSAESAKKEARIVTQCQAKLPTKTVARGLGVAIGDSWVPLIGRGAPLPLKAYRKFAVAIDTDAISVNIVESAEGDAEEESRREKYFNGQDDDEDEEGEEKTIAEICLSGLTALEKDAGAKVEEIDEWIVDDEEEDEDDEVDFTNACIPEGHRVVRICADATETKVTFRMWCDSASEEVSVDFS
eukprot:TRINITY_DN4765_c0_g1_i1.p1 TRINITY_DN4765_c0_g1~~TRINITY_DN4765_c0_g1_i1.p1  ORF type:complete len:590 (-),score=239.35 TRINITY_DN4765_c0_g1_i1:57-1766(-)